MSESPVEFAMRVIESADVLLLFPDRVGPAARFGFHRGRWVIVTELTDGYMATTTDREAVKKAIAEGTEKVEVVSVADDRAWHWLEAEGTPDHEMIASYCSCGQYKCSTNSTHVESWADRHKRECYSRPRVQYG